MYCTETAAFVSVLPPKLHAVDYHIVECLRPMQLISSLLFLFKEKLSPLI